MQELKSGYTINNRYEIVEKKSDGTLGTSIYLGRDLDKKCDVIIRILGADMLEDEECKSRFLQGADITKKLNHSNILSLLDAGEDGDILFLIINYEKGFFLNDYLEHRGELGEKEALQIIRALSDALNYAWSEQKIIHRNISPETILVAKGNIPMLTDFDLAKSLEDNKNLTLSGFTVGDPNYMSPEQARGEGVDFRSDIYCLGLVFYQLIAGKPPFQKQSRMDTLRAQISERHKSIKSLNSSITDATESLLDKMLVKDLSNRYQSWNNLIKDLDAILNEETSSTLKKVLPSKTSSKYKMQAVQMQAVVVPDCNIAPVVIPEVVEEKVISVDVTHCDGGKSSKSKRNFLYALTAIVIIIILIVVSKLFIPSSNKSGLKVSSNTIQKNINDTKKNIDDEIVKEIVLESTNKDLQSRKVSFNNIKQIGIALQMYANVYEGKYPKLDGVKGLDLLRSGGFLEIPQVFISPSSGNMAADMGKPLTDNSCDYIYTGALSEYSKPKTPILWTKPNLHKNFGIILYVNGDIEKVEGNNWLFKTK